MKVEASLTDAPPPPVWPSEWICYTNITRQGYPHDYGTQIYSWSNRAQTVLHSDLFSFSALSQAGQSTLIWRDDVAYKVSSNYNECCVLSSFPFAMPRVNWTDLLSYEGEDIFNNIPSYLYTNPDVMAVKYWQSIETGLPVGWLNIPDPDYPPIIQYFYAAVNYSEPLSADYFALPTSCSSASACVPMEVATTDVNCQESSDISLSNGAFSGVCLAFILLGVLSTIGTQYFMFHVVGSGRFRDGFIGGSNSNQGGGKEKDKASLVIRGAEFSSSS